MKRITLGSSSITQKEIDEVTRVLKNNYISPGPVVEWVEKETAKGHGLRFGLCLNSGQSAIEIGLKALDRKYSIAQEKLTKLMNGEQHYIDTGGAVLVAVPATTYISTLAAVHLVGFEMVLVDVGLDGNMCPDSLRRVLDYQISIGEPVDIVLPVHLYGKACSDDIRLICQDPKYNLLVLEDACESMFAPNIGWGHICTSSFYANHLLSAGGGGIIMTNDDELDMLCWKLINHGRAERFGNDDIHRIAEKFKFNDWGFSLKWNDVSAAIAKAQIERKEELYAKRARNATTLTTSLRSEMMAGKIFLPEHYGHTFMMYPIVVLDKNIDPLKVIRGLNDRGVEIRRMMPITNQDVVKNYFELRGISNLDERFPNADFINKRGFYVGVHPEINDDDAKYLATAIKASLEEAESK